MRDLELRGIGRIYGGPGGPREVLRDLSLRLPAGEVVGLVGPSGCGKTTIVRLLAGLDRPQRGTVAPDPAGLRIGMVFQDPRLLPWRTVEANVRLAVPSARAAMLIDGLLTRFGLDGHRGSFPGSLSPGLMRRVALVRALAVEPELFVLDEPFVSLDEASAAILRRATFEAIAGRAVTVLWVTHDWREVLAFADRIVLLDGRPAQVLAEVVLDVPRVARDGAWIERQRLALAARYAGGR